MATAKATIEFILEKLGSPQRFSARAMFGEYALYADDKVVALVCDNLLYVKVRPASAALAKYCPTDTPYPGAKEHYVVTEDQLAEIGNLPAILFALAKTIPAKKKRVLKK